MTRPDLTPSERARRVVAAELQRLGEHVLERDAAAASIIDKLTTAGHLPEDPTPIGDRYAPAACTCYGPKPRPAVLDRQRGTHALHTSRDAAARWATRWSTPGGPKPSRLIAWHPIGDAR